MKKFFRKNLSKITKGIIIFIFGMALIMCMIKFSKKEDKNLFISNAELNRARTYAEVQDGEDAIQQTEYVKFDAFFLRDIDQDGYANKIRGTCKEIGKTDTLYMELNVLTQGSLENGVITIEGDNFNSQMVLPKDTEIAKNAIGDNVRRITLNTLNNGTQKLLTSIISENLENDTNRYSKVNTVKLTGDYVATNGERTKIEKVVQFNLDWYGTTNAVIDNLYVKKDKDNIYNEETEELNLTFDITTLETKKQLILKESYIEGEIPELNGYSPKNVEITGTNVTYTYNKITREYTAKREAILNTNKVVSTQCYDGTINSGKYNSYSVKVTYPKEAYEAVGKETIELKIPVRAYYEGYNLTGEGFNNPYKSNIAKDIVLVQYEKPTGEMIMVDVTVGDYISLPYHDYIVSKQKPLRIYNELSEEEINDNYLVKWQVHTDNGIKDNSKGVTLKETYNEAEKEVDKFIKADTSEESMENITTNVGIYFSGADGLIGPEGWIKVYNDETGELIETFTKQSWYKYTVDNPYKYEIPIKHIRVETSNTNANASFLVYNIKQLNDEYITQHYQRTQFDNFKYIKSTLVGYYGGSYINTDSHRARYEIEYSIANVEIDKKELSTQLTEKNVTLTIRAEGNEKENQIKWRNGSFLLKMPKGIIDVQISRVRTSRTDIEIKSYEQYEKDGNIYIKILTENDTKTEYNITVDCDITPNPTNPTTRQEIELYATNEEAIEYFYKGQDTYDVNGNLNYNEMVNRTTVGINLISPNSLLTSQTATEYDDKGSSITAPQIADIDLKQKSAKVNVQVTNNYNRTISEVKIVGRIPFIGNKYVINEGNLNSEFNTTMENTGIQIPDSLKSDVTIYYSDNENATEDIELLQNNWQKDNIDFKRVKSYLIDFGQHILNKNDKIEISYKIEIPNNVKYNQISYSHHAVYFALDTEEGKYETKTEPNKLGFRIAKKYDLEIIKYQKSKSNKVEKATYYVCEKDKEEGKTKVTDPNGTLLLEGLYIGKTYIVKEIKSPQQYELNEDEIEFTTSEEGEILKVTKNKGTVKNIKATQAPYKVHLEVEDEVKANLKIKKVEQGKTEGIQKIKFKLTEGEVENTRRYITTDENGEVTLTGISIGKQYTLEEVKAEGYYIGQPIKFTITNENGSYNVNLIQGTVNNKTITINNEIPELNLTIENEKIPTYDLQILKIKKQTEVTAQNASSKIQPMANPTIEPLAGAKFKLYKGTEEIGEYQTDSSGKIKINGLYQFESTKNIDQTYTLKEIISPSGYSKVKDIIFKAQMVDGKLQLQEQIEAGQTAKKYNVNGNTIELTVEDTPTFKLIKKDARTNQLLANVKFAIYNIDEGEEPARNSKGEILGTPEIINGNEYYTLTTNAQGEITADLTEGLYKAVEIQADEKYDINNTYYFGIGASIEEKTELRTMWGKAYGGTDYDNVSKVVATNDGGVITLIKFQSEKLYFEGEEILNKQAKKDDIIIAKYDKYGKMQWKTVISGDETEEIMDVKLTDDGNLVVAGYTNSNVLEIDRDITINKKSDQYGFLILYDENGKVKWHDEIQSEDELGPVTVNGIDTVNNEIFVVGEFRGDIKLNNEDYLKRECKYNGDDFLIKYNEDNGKVIFSKHYVGENYKFSKVLITENNKIVICGDVFGSDMNAGIDFDNQYLYGDIAAISDIMLCLCNENGEIEKAKRIGSPNFDSIGGITLTKDDGIVLCLENDSKEVDLGDGKKIERSDNDDILVKYNLDLQIEWKKFMGKVDIFSLIETRNGDIAICGQTDETNIENKLPVLNQGTIDAIIATYDKDGNLKSAKTIGGKKVDYFVSIDELTDDSLVMGGTFYSDSINIGETFNLQGTNDAMIVKLIQQDITQAVTMSGKSIGGTSDDVIESIDLTKDGGEIVGMTFSSDNVKLDNGETINNINSKDGLLIKYGKNGEIDWYKTIAGQSDDTIKSVIETKDGGIIVGIETYSSEISFENHDSMYQLPNNIKVLVIKYDKDGNLQWYKPIQSNSTVNIVKMSETTDGGVILLGSSTSKTINLGNDYQINKKEDNSSLASILIKYDENGEISSCTSLSADKDVKIYSLYEEDDGGILVGGQFGGDTSYFGKYKELQNSEEGNAILIKYTPNMEIEWFRKIGSYLYGKITTMCKTSDGGMVICGIFYNDNSNIIKYDKNGNLQWNRSLGMAVSIESVQETKDNGVLISFNTERRLYIENLGNLSGFKYYGVVIKYNKDGMILFGKNIDGSDNDYISAVMEKQDGTILVGGYYESSTLDIGDGKTLQNNGRNDGFLVGIHEQVGVPELQELEVKNKIKQLKVTTDVKEINGEKGGTIDGEDQNPYETVEYGKNSTLPIKMVPKPGYEIIDITVNGAEYSFKENTDKTFQMQQFTEMKEDKHVVVTYAKTSQKLVINKVDKNTGSYLTGAKFRIEQLNVDDPYIAELETNSKGQVIAQIPYGKYKITELKAPEGYDMLIDSVTINFQETTKQIEGGNTANAEVNGQFEFVIKNEKQGKVIVHHYIKGTQRSLADDDILYGKIGKKYSTSPHLDFEKYELEIGTDGEYVLPNNATGDYQEKDQVVIYEYVKKKVPLIVHHYIEGTEEKVPLASGGVAQDETDSQDEGTTYTTHAIEGSRLSDKYELSKTPSNSNGTYEFPRVEVTYFYKEVERKLIIRKYEEDGKTLLQGVKFNIKNTESGETKEYTTDEKGRIEVFLKAGTYEITETEAPEKYEIPTNVIETITINKETTIKEVNVTNKVKQGKVIVHHYIDGTKDRVPSNVKDQVVQDETRTGDIGSIYATKQAENVQKNYYFVRTEGETSGLLEEKEKEVIYYYKIQTPTIESPVITKTSSTEKAKEFTQAIDYQIKYKATVDNYIGNATVTIVDYLPYEINESLSDKGGGTYSKENRTITWVENVNNIDTYANNKKVIEYTKNVSLVYINIDTSRSTIDNRATGTIHLDTPEKEDTKEATKQIPTEYLTNVTVTKVWDHTNNNYTIPTQVKLILKNGNNQVAEKVINTSNKVGQDNNTWKWTFENVPKYNTDGNEIAYTVDELEVTEGDLKYYRKDISNSGNREINIKNTYIGPIITKEKKVTTEHNKDYVIEGEKITYAIEVQNAGGIEKDVKIQDTIPTGTTLVSGSIRVNGETTHQGQNVSNKTAQELESGITVKVPAKEGSTNGKTTLSFVVTVNELEANTYTKVLTNIATVDGSTTNDVTNTVKKPNIKVSKESEPASGNKVKLNDEITYKIKLKNEGTAPGTVKVKDVVPVGTTFVTGSIKISNQSTYQGQDLSRKTANDLQSGISITVEVGREETLEFKVKVNDIDDQQQIKNQATITEETVHGPEDKTTNEVVHTYVEPIITKEKQVTTEHNKDYVIEGEKITYSIVVQNEGGLGKDVLIQDTIPVGTTLVSGSVRVNGGTTYQGQDISNKTAQELQEGITVNVPAKEGNTNGKTTLSFVVIVNELEVNTYTKDLTNIARVDGNTTNEVTKTVKKPNIKISKETEPANGSKVKLNDEITYKIKLRNEGTAPGTAKVKDIVPDGTTFVAGSIKVSGQTSYQGEDLKNKTAEDLKNGISVTVEPGSEETLEFKVKVKDIDDQQKIRNKATTTEETVHGPEDKTTNEVVHTYVEPIISQTKAMETERNKEYVMAGEKITYTITIKNEGGLGKNIVVKDQIPEGTTFVEGSIEIDGQKDTSKTEQDLSVNGISLYIAEMQNQTPSQRIIKFSVRVKEDARGDIKNTATVDEKTTDEVKIPVLNFKKTSKVIRKHENSVLRENEVIVGDSIYYGIIVSNEGSQNIYNIEVKDVIPYGTKVKDMVSSGTEINWVIEEIPAGTEKEVGFTVEVVFINQDKYTIKNVATVEGQKTNETENPYIKPDPSLESTLKKDGTDVITSKEEKVQYKVDFSSNIDYFVGKAVVTLVDTLPFPIDKNKSNIDNGIYDEASKTITWTEEITGINTELTGEKQINITKNLELSFIYGSLNNTTGKMVNTVHSKIELYKQISEDPEQYEKVTEDEKDAEKETKIEIPARVIVHHYIYDAETKQYTTTKIADDETQNGIVGQNYSTKPSVLVPQNYKCINTTPEKYEGNMTEEEIVVIYYYQLKKPTVYNEIEKEVAINIETEDTEEQEDQNEQQEEKNISAKEIKRKILKALKLEQRNTRKIAQKEIPVLRREDGVVSYKISYDVLVADYIGKVRIEIVDKLPAKIDEQRSELNGGTYNEENQTITWIEEIEDVNTFEDGAYTNEIVKEIEIVYKEQNVLEDLVNVVTGKVQVYYPEKHSTKPGEVQIEKEDEDEKTIKQEYTVHLRVEKIWDDSENVKERRPEGVIVEITQEPSGQVATRELNEENEWKVQQRNLPKYMPKTGEKIKYIVTEKEVNELDLEYYESPVITEVENQNDETTKYTYTITNSYKLLETDLDTELIKEGPDEITASKQEVEYTINFTGKISDYIGEGRVTIVDTLPYKIDEEKSELDGGKYDSEKQTITWEDELPHINTDIAKENYKIDIQKHIKVVFTDLDPTAEKMENNAKGKIVLYETEEKDEKEATKETDINIRGKVIVRYVDIDSGKDIEYKEIDENGEEQTKTYQYEIEDKVGVLYETDKKELDNYIYVKSTENERGTIKEGEQEVIYYYTRIPAKVIVKHQDTKGNPLAEDEIIEGKIWDPYTTKEKEIENYQFVSVTDNKEGTMTKETITVIYVYDKIPTRVIVKYLEKGTEKELLEEDIIEGLAGDDYTTKRKEVKNYRKAEPEPNNKEGKMTPEEIIVIYYYEKIPSGRIIVKYVDKDTNEEIIYEEEGKEKTYGYEIKGYVGEVYNTEEKDIPYYEFVESTDNTKGTLKEKDDEVIYYYRKLQFNLKIEKWMSSIQVNGEEELGKNYETRNEIYKLDIHRKKLETTNVTVRYKIRVTNIGEIEGKAEEITEIIPSGYSFYQEDNSVQWENNNGVLKTTELAKETIKPGEYKEIGITLRWNKGDQNLGKQENIAKITKTSNVAGFEETTQEDNQSRYTMLIAISTGVEANIQIIIIIASSIILIIGSSIIIKKVKKVEK